MYNGKEFTLDTLTFREKIAQLLHGSAYPNRHNYILDRMLSPRQWIGENQEVIIFTDWLSDWLKSTENIGGIHLFRSDARTLEEANTTIIEVMARSKIPPFISMDLTGGFTRHLGISFIEAKKHGVPDEFMEMANKSGTELPSQEDIGRVFKALIKKEDYIGQIRFRNKIGQYGSAIASICHDIGISVNFAPVLDVIENPNGSQFMEKNNETYGNDLYIVMVLGFHYMKGFQEASATTIIAPKHFIGTGKMSTNPHKEDTGASTMKPRDGSMLPFKDAIYGQLFVDPLWSGYVLDYQLRSLKKIKYHEAAIYNLNIPSNRISAKLAKKLWHIEYIYNEFGIDGSFYLMPPIKGLMVGHAQNYININTPGALDHKIVREKLRHSLKFKGIVWTDDLRMRAIDIHVKALAVDVTIPMILHSSGSLDELASRVQWAIKNREDFDGDSNPDITMEGINERVRLILEQKALLGLLTSTAVKTKVKCPNPKEKLQCLREVIVYRNNSKAYMLGTRAYQSDDKRTRDR